MVCRGSMGNGLGVVGMHGGGRDMGMRSVAGWFLGAGIVLRSKRFPRCWKWGAGLLLGGLAVTGFGWGVCVHAADAQGGIAITGRGNGPVRIVDPDGSVQEISPDRLKFPNQPGSRLSEGHRGEGAGASGSAGGALKMREERVRKEGRVWRKRGGRRRRRRRRRRKSARQRRRRSARKRLSGITWIRSGGTVRIRRRKSRSRRRVRRC